MDRDAFLRKQLADMLRERSSHAGVEEATAVLVEDPATDIWVSRPWMDGWTILREVLLSIDHLAYHLGEIVVIRRALGAWPAPNAAGPPGVAPP